MEGNNCRPAQGENSSMEIPSSDWRSQIQPEARQRIVNKIMDILRRHLPVAVPEAEGMSELKKIAVRFEEMIYTAAISQSDYLRKIALKMLYMETKTQKNTQINHQLVINQNSSKTVLPSLRTLDRSRFSSPSQFLSMDGNNWRPVQGKSSSMEIPSSDWRSQLQPEARQRIVNKIMDILSRPLPVAVPEGMSELKKIAVRIEEKIYTTAINQSDYLRKISLKMLSMEKKTQQNTQINPQPVINQNSSEAVLPSLRTLDRSPFSSPSRFLSMEGNKWRPAQGEPSSMEIPSSDWRSQLKPEARQRIINKIMDTLRRHLPVAVPEGMSELKKIAVRFEEKIYTAAINQSDYLRKIALKMLSMETKTQQNTQINPQPVINQNSSETVSPGIPPQVNNQVPIIDSIGRKQLLAPNLQISAPASVQGSSSLSNMPNMSGISHSSVNNSLAQGTTTDIYANAQRHVQGRQQQQQSQNPLLYQNQLQPQLMKQKVHNNPLLQPPMQQQQQQQILSQTNKLKHNTVETNKP